jgi:hypothetical protein
MVGAQALERAFVSGAQRQLDPLDEALMGQPASTAESRSTRMVRSRSASDPRRGACDGGVLVTGRG